MCGIAGEIRAAASSDTAWAERRRQLERMLQTLEPRGPDAVGYFQDQQATMGVRRLAIVDLAGGNQPLSTADGRYTITYNGECYEIDDLRESLSHRGIRFRTQCDTEVVLQAYATWGAAGLERLQGMFALAIWDAWQGELFLARDRLGIKPLYYAQDDQRILFGSTVQALAARHDLSCDIDSNALELILSSRCIPAPYSIYRAIRKLPAGFWARWRAGRFQVQRWWDLPVDAATDHAISERAALDQLDQLLDRATRGQVAEERPTGLCLSGGIDSGLLASGLRDQPVPTFSLAPSAPGRLERCGDESPTALRVARQFGLQPYIVRLPTDPRRLWHDVVGALDEPLADSSCLALHALGRGMVPQVTVALSGTGGDELFGGYLRYLASRWAAWNRMMPSLQPIAKHVRSLSLGSPGARLLEALPCGPLGCYLRLIDPASASISPALRLPEFVQSVEVSFAELADECFARPRRRGLLTKLSYVDLKLQLADGYLAKEDRMLMAHSLEGRFPFLDHRLVEFAFCLPDRLKLRNLETKRLLRRLALRRGLPPAIVRRRKQGFEVPLAKWLRGPLVEPLKDHLLHRNAWIKGYLQPQVVNRLVQEHTAATHDHGRLLWCLFLLESWYQRQATQRQTTQRSSPLPLSDDALTSRTISSQASRPNASRPDASRQSTDGFGPSRHDELCLEPANQPATIASRLADRSSSLPSYLSGTQLDSHPPSSFPAPHAWPATPASRHTQAQP